MSILMLQEIFKTQEKIELAVLIGSRATNSAKNNSDWDIAIRWENGMAYMKLLSETENLRRRLATALKINDSQVDLIDLSRAGLAMRTVVAEEGIVLKGEDELVWNHFLSRVWRELEDFEWEKQHAA